MDNDLHNVISSDSYYEGSWEGWNINFQNVGEIKGSAHLYGSRGMKRFSILSKLNKNTERVNFT